MSLVEYIQKIRPLASKEIFALLNDDIYRLGLLEAERYVTAHKVRTSLTQIYFGSSCPTDLE